MQRREKKQTRKLIAEMNALVREGIQLEQEIRFETLPAELDQLAQK